MKNIILLGLLCLFAIGCSSRSRSTASKSKEYKDFSSLRQEQLNARDREL